MWLQQIIQLRYITVCVIGGLSFAVVKTYPFMFCNFLIDQLVYTIFVQCVLLQFYIICVMFSIIDYSAIHINQTVYGLN